MLKYRRVLTILCCMAALAAAQDLIYPSVTQIREAFNNLNFKRVVELSGRAVDAYADYPTEQLVLVYQYRAMAFYNLGSEMEAAGSFKAALSLQPELVLDPVTVSPKIRKFFDEIKAGYRTENVSPLQPVETRYIQLEDLRPQAVWRSMILPGWGQHYKGQEVKGYIIFSGFLVNTIGLITAVIYEKSSRDAYLDATLPDEIESRFQEYERWNNVRRVLTGTGVAIWLYAFGDALWSVTPTGTDVSVTVSPGKISANIWF